MQFYSVMAFAHRYDKNKDDYGDNNYCYDDIPKVAIVFIYKSKWIANKNSKYHFF